jgi:phosphopantetheinyl transferase
MRERCDQMLGELADSMLATNAGGWEIRRKSGCAPRLYRDGVESELNVSVAHSCGWVAVGIANDTAIGVDIQAHEEQPRYREIAEFLDLGESAADDQQHFFSRWTLREAIAKATDTSLLTPHAVEADLRSACRRQGSIVNAGPFTAMVDIVNANAHLAVVLNRDGESQLCA